MPACTAARDLAECRCLVALGSAVESQFCHVPGAAWQPAPCLRSGGGQQALSCTVARRQSCVFVTGHTDRPALRGTRVWQSRTSPDSKHRASLAGSLLPKSPFLPAVLSLGDLWPESVPRPTSGCGPRCGPSPPVCARTPAGESVPLGLCAPRPVTSLSTAGAQVLSSPCCPHSGSSGFSGFPLGQQLCPGPCGEGPGYWALSHCGHLSSGALALWSRASAWTSPRGRGLRSTGRLLKSLCCPRMCLLLSPLALSCVTACPRGQ